MITRILNRIECRIGRHRGIRNLMAIIVIGTAVIYLADYILPSLTGGFTLSYFLSFNKARILRGEIWRLLTFVFVPSGGSNILMFAIGLYFDWIMGEMLQSHWGTLRFNLFYFTGVLGAIISGFITGYSTAYYLNASLMLAMACIQPDMPLSLYGIINIRLKWLALLSVAMMLLPLITSPGWDSTLALAAALLNVLIFLGGRLSESLRNARRRRQWKRNWHNSQRR